MMRERSKAAASRWSPHLVNLEQEKIFRRDRFCIGLSPVLVEQQLGMQETDKGENS
jgi:hypothetical protein